MFQRPIELSNMEDYLACPSTGVLDPFRSNPIGNTVDHTKVVSVEASEELGQTRALLTLARKLIANKHGLLISSIIPMLGRCI